MYFFFHSFILIVSLLVIVLSVWVWWRTGLVTLHSSLVLCDGGVVEEVVGV